MAEKDSAEDIETLRPERTLTLRGERVVVREFGFFEGVEVTAIAAPLLDDMSREFLADEDVSLETLQRLLAKHKEIFFRLMALSINKPVEWLKAPDFPDAEGQMLLNTFWVVNSHFFVHRLMTRLAARQLSGKESPASSPH